MEKPVSDLHHSVSRMAAGLILFHDNTKGEIRAAADNFADEVIAAVHNDLRNQIDKLDVERAKGIVDADEFSLHTLRATLKGIREGYADVLRMME